MGIDDNDPRRGIFRSRNDGTRKWAYNHPSGRVSILDFDSLSWTDGAPLGLIGNWTDWHYGESCARMDAICALVRSDLLHYLAQMRQEKLTFLTLSTAVFG